MSVCLVAGYGLLASFDIKQGFLGFIDLLICMSISYTASRRRLFQRIAGTCSGLLLSFLPTLVFTNTSVQLVLMAIYQYCFRTVKK